MPNYIFSFFANLNYNRSGVVVIQCTERSRNALKKSLVLDSSERPTREHLEVGHLPTFWKIEGWILATVDVLS